MVGTRAILSPCDRHASVAARSAATLMIGCNDVGVMRPLCARQKKKGPAVRPAPVEDNDEPGRTS
jgi:hypothetical protein